MQQELFSNFSRESYSLWFTQHSDSCDNSCDSYHIASHTVSAFISMHQHKRYIKMDCSHSQMVLWSVLDPFRQSHLYSSVSDKVVNLILLAWQVMSLRGYCHLLLISYIYVHKYTYIYTYMYTCKCIFGFQTWGPSSSSTAVSWHAVIQFYVFTKLNLISLHIHYVIFKLF